MHRPRDLLTIASLLLISLGFWMAWPPLGLIVPGCIVFGCLVAGRLREDRPGGKGSDDA